MAPLRVLDANLPEMRCQLQRILLTWLRLLALSSLGAIMMACGGGGGGGTTPPPPLPPAPPPPQNITYSINVSSGPEEATASIGSSAEASVTWSFSASATDAGSTSYTVRSATSGVQITGGSGSVVPGTSISTQLAFSCTASGTIEAEITFTVGSATESVTWTINCTEEQITFMPLADVRVEQDEAASAVLTWSFETSGESESSLSYEVISESDRLQISNATGSSLPGTEIENRLRYACRDVGTHVLALQIRVGSASQRVEWSVACTVEDIQAITAEFHQGPLVEQAEFAMVDDQWQAEVIPLFYTGQRPLRLGSNRQMFVTLSFESEVESEIDISLESSNTSDDVTIELVGASNLVPNLSGTRTNYTRRIVFDVTANDLSTLDELRILIDPDDLVPQRNEERNSIVFDISNLEIIELPHLRLTLIPIVSSTGEPDLSDTGFYEDVLYELLPIGTYSVSVSEAIDITSEGAFDVNDALNAVFESWLTTGDRDEFFHGIFTPPDNVEVCGVAHVGGNSGATGESSELCSNNTFAHEMGHNLSLNHAPACGAEEANPDPNFAYTDGSIGTEGGWLMRQRKSVGLAGLASRKIYDIMSYCLETFTSQYSYGKANDYFVRRFGTTVAASEPPNRVVPGFEIIEGRSLVLMGSLSRADGWELHKAAFVDKPPFPPSFKQSEFELQLVHMASGTLLYRETVHPMVVAHGDPDKLPWGLRIPAFKTSGLHFLIVDKEGNVLIEAEISKENN